MITKSKFGELDDNQSVHKFTLSNGIVEVDIIEFGATITSIRTPDSNGDIDDIVLGFDDLKSYMNPHPYFGVLVGRYGNRIANASFSIDGQLFKLAPNDDPNSLHGGVEGFDKKLWTSKVVDNHVIELTYDSQDGEEGFPGILSCMVRYELTTDNELKLTYRGTTNRKTICNLTNHSYFNLNGHNSGDVLNHELTILADTYNPVDEHMIPLGTYAPVDNTPFDFRSPNTIGARIRDNHEQLIIGQGYDHNYVIDSSDSGQLKLISEVYAVGSGRTMEVYSTEPGVQLYTGNFLDGVIGKKESTYDQHCGFCLETQHFPDSPNQPQFPTTILNVGEIYSSETIYKFGTK